MVIIVNFKKWQKHVRLLMEMHRREKDSTVRSRPWICESSFRLHGLRWAHLFHNWRTIHSFIWRANNNFMENSHIRLEAMKHKPDLKNRSDLCEIQTKGSHSFTILQRIIWLSVSVYCVSRFWMDTFVQRIWLKTGQSPNFPEMNKEKKTIKLPIYATITF